MTRRACAVHPEELAVGRCASCSRDVCLDCAIPVRGRVLCDECTAAEVGETAPPPPPPGAARRLDLRAGVLFLAGALVSVLPWDRAGELTGLFSAWTRGASWALVAGVCLLLGAAVSLARLPADRLAMRLAGTSYAVLGLGAAVATLVTLAGTPEFGSRTPVPYAVLALATGAALVGGARLRRAA